MQLSAGYTCMTASAGSHHHGEQCLGYLCRLALSFEDAVSVHLLDVAWLPALVEPRFERTI